MGDKKSTSQKRYESLVNRSFEALLRYKIFDEIVMQKHTQLDFDCFHIPKTVEEAFSAQYDPGQREFLRDNNKEARKYRGENRKVISAYKKKYKVEFSTGLSLEEFSQFWGEQDSDRVCGYCGVSEREIALLRKKEKLYTKRLYSRGMTMEVDRKKPEGPYSINNIILSCYWCNNAKTDEFTYAEFLEIAKEFKKVWEQRLAKVRDTQILTII